MTDLGDDAWEALVVPVIRRGYSDAVAGKSRDANPCATGTVWGAAWLLGHMCGSWPRPIRWVLAWWMVRK